MEIIHKIKNKLAQDTYKYWRQFLFLIIISQELFIYLLQTIVFVGRKLPLGNGHVFLLDMASKILGLFFAVLFFFSYLSRNDKSPVKEKMIQIWKDCAVIAFIVFVLEYIPIMAFQYVGLKYPLPAILASIAIGVIFFVLLAVKTLQTVIDMQPIEYEKRKQVWKPVNKKIVKILATLGIDIWILTGSYLLNELMDILKNWLGVGYNKQLLLIVVSAIIHWAIYASYFSYMRSAFTPAVAHELSIGSESILAEEPEKESDIDEQSETKKIEANEETDTLVRKKCKMRFSEVCAGIVTVMAVVLWIADSIVMFKQNERIDIQTYMEQIVTSAREEIEQGSRDEGIRLYVQAQEYMQALDYYADENIDALRNLMKEYPSENFYWQLYYANMQDVGLLEEKAITNPGTIGYYHDLLAVYAELEKQDEEESTEEVQITELESENAEEISWRDYCMQKCLDNGKFRAEYACMDRESLKKINISQLHKQYDEELSYGTVLRELVNTGVKGKIDKESLYKILDMADERADNLAYQLIAIEYSSEYLEDDASHYERILEAAKRYDALFMKMNPTDEEIIEEKIYLVEIMMDCEDYANALEFMNSVDDKGNAIIEDYVMICYSELEQNEELATYTKALIDKEREKANIYYYAALSNLKIGLLDESIAYGVMLSDIVINSTDEEKEFNNALLNSYVQYLCISDKYENYIQYRYRVKEFTQEQCAVIEEAPLLREYINASNGIYNLKDYELARKALDEVDKLSPDLSITWFLRGTSYFNEEKYEEAMQCFKKCIQIDPDNVTALYCMAALYDRAGEYEMSYQMCNQVIERLPYVNHEIDWYGVAYHIAALKEKLSPYIAEADQ